VCAQRHVKVTLAKMNNDMTSNDLTVARRRHGLEVKDEVSQGSRCNFCFS
jgi:hypothetical protein